MSGRGDLEGAGERQTRLAGDWKREGLVYRGWWGTAGARGWVTGVGEGQQVAVAGLLRLAGYREWLGPAYSVWQPLGIPSRHSTPDAERIDLWRHVELRNFRSIEHAVVDLAPFTVVVGRNGSGKSNFVDALLFASELGIDAARAVDRRGGLAGIRRSGPRRQHGIVLDVRAASTQSELKTDYVGHRCGLTTNPEKKTWDIGLESIEIFVRAEVTFRIKRNRNKYLKGVGIRSTATPLASTTSMMLYERQTPSRRRRYAPLLSVFR